MDLLEYAKNHPKSTSRQNRQSENTVDFSKLCLSFKKLNKYREELDKLDENETQLCSREWVFPHFVGDVGLEKNKPPITMHYDVNAWLKLQQRILRTMALDDYMGCIVFIQCKNHAKNIGRTPVQALGGLLSRRSKYHLCIASIVVVSRNDDKEERFDRSAREEADTCPNPMNETIIRKTIS
ncbi:5503_t:CDS:2 [Paraglomus brasilianum]|uniref:5503_t:CDS:1 n=1 Tax=Paraglomus brasilianum TaxID=144538 RepID=A0A9N9DZ05_9GLOM|nr:5503_t:CDS:2 [Paraglomus brasilianum]